MTWKAIVYSAHAVRRLRQRGITRHQVRNLLATGHWRQQTAKWLVEGWLDTGPVRVVVRESSDSITVVTVMWIR